MTSPLDRLSLRTRLVAGTVLLVAVGLLVAGGTATSALRDYQLTRVDEQLTQAANSPLLRDGGGGRGRWGPTARLPGELYRALLDQSGEVLSTSTTSTGDGPQVPRLTSREARDLGLRPFTVDALNRRGQWRVVAVPITSAGATGTLLLASDLGEVEGTVNRLIAL